jgi:hypothetical protein
MQRNRSSLPFLCAIAAAGIVPVFDAAPARACGGCFHEPSPTQTVASVVTDHRMAFSISPAQTVLWDQIVYSGNPTEFAWVLPVKAGARIELSQDAWFAALDASTATVITGPAPVGCPGSAPTDYEGGGGGGCALGGESSDSAEGFSSAPSAGATPPAVQVVSQSVVGPYDAVTVRSSQGEALGTWLRQNGYDVPATIQPTIDAFTTEGFDFIALKLRPGEGVQAMQPVRVVTQGADPSLPLRMVAAGVGARVGIELFVLSEGRYHTQNFPDATIDFSKLAWDPYQSRSNYSSLAEAAMSAGSGTGWLTEFAGIAPLYGGSGLTPPLAQTYQSTCVSRPPPPCTTGDAAAPAPGVDAGDAADDGGDAGDDGGDAAQSGGDASASTDADTTSSGVCSMQPALECDDLDVATVGITYGNLWITRLRAQLPSTVLAADLVLEAAPTQDTISNLHSTSTYTVPDYNPCGTSSQSAPSSSSGSSHSGGSCSTSDTPRTRYGDAIALLAGAVGIAFGMRKRRPR